MRIFEMPDIQGGFKDLWDYLKEDRPHRWTALGLAITLTGVIFCLSFWKMGRNTPMIRLMG